MNVKIIKLGLIGINYSFAYAAGLRCNDEVKTTRTGMARPVLQLIFSWPCSPLVSRSKLNLLSGHITIPAQQIR